jgi:hypothetical protein
MSNWLAEQIATTNEPSSELPNRIKNILKSNYAKKIITNELIELKNNIQGKEAWNIIYQTCLKHNNAFVRKTCP